MTNLQKKSKSANCAQLLLNKSYFLRLKPLKEYDNLFKASSYLSFMIDLKWAMYENDLISREAYMTCKEDYMLTVAHIRKDEVSKYLYSALRKASFILCDAVLLNEENILSDGELLEIAKTVYQTFWAKTESINKQCRKARFKKSGLDNNGLAKLRAQVATLNNEN